MTIPHMNMRLAIQGKNLPALIDLLKKHPYQALISPKNEERYGGWTPFMYVLNGIIQVGPENQEHFFYKAFENLTSFYNQVNLLLLVEQRNASGHTVFDMLFERIDEVPKKITLALKNCSLSGYQAAQELSKKHVELEEKKIEQQTSKDLSITDWVKIPSDN
ncbi:MAG: hypothetical protein AAGI90_01805 [Chlamydiota bacterium]